MAEEKTKVSKREKFGNCPGCGKLIKKLKRYYRNNKYYCTKVCYKKFLSKAGKKEKGAS